MLHDENRSIVKLVAFQVAYTTGVSGALVSPGRVEDTDGANVGHPCGIRVRA